MEEFSWDFLKKILYFCHDKMILHGGGEGWKHGTNRFKRFHPHLPKKNNIQLGKMRQWWNGHVQRRECPLKFNWEKEGTPSQHSSAKSVWLASPTLPLKRRLQYRNNLRIIERKAGELSQYGLVILSRNII